MTAPTLPLEDALREAQQPGDLSPPKTLLDALAIVEDPVAALMDKDESNRLFATLESEFCFIRSLRPSDQSLKHAEQIRWISLLRWLIREVKAWRHTEDPIYRKLMAIFIVTQVSDPAHVLWRLMPAEIRDNTDLIQSLKNLVGSLSYTFLARGGLPDVTWEQYRTADEAGDWVGISEGLMLFKHQLSPTTFHIQSVLFLYESGIDHLVNALDNLRQTAVAVLIARVLPLDHKLRVAAASNNAYIQFGFVYDGLSRRRRALPMSPDGEQLLTMVLLKVAEDSHRWCGWMRVFNTYPIRYPALQVSLGYALADTLESAVETYVNTIHLYPKDAKLDEGQRIVPECLRAFRTTATSARREFLWARAYQRWSEWNFDELNGNAHLFGICWSDLDYAVVAFASECMTNAERKEKEDAIRYEMQVLDLQWHESFIDIVTIWNRLLSQFQPFAHASQMGLNTEDWLTKSKTYFPFDPSSNQYVMQKYRVG